MMFKITTIDSKMMPKPSTPFSNSSKNLSIALKNEPDTHLLPVKSFSLTYPPPERRRIG
jgi:hypothetical protein